MRVQAHAFDYGYDGEQAGNDYTGDLALRTAGVLVDWHPRGAFRLTVGAYANGNEMDARAEATALDVGGGLYEGDLRLSMSFDRVARYLGVGWRSGRARRGLGVAADLVVLLQGPPTVSAVGEIGRGRRCTVAVSAKGRTSSVRGAPGCAGPGRDLNARNGNGHACGTSSLSVVRSAWSTASSSTGPPRVAGPPKLATSPICARPANGEGRNEHTH